MKRSWLTSGEHYFWDVPREVTVHDVRRGPDGREHARLEVAADQPDGPMTLLAAPREGRRWKGPGPLGRRDVLLWTVTDPAAVWKDGGVQPPKPAHDAWAVLTSSREQAERLARSVSGGGR